MTLVAQPHSEQTESPCAAAAAAPSAPWLPVRTAWLVVVGALVLGSVLNSAGLEITADSQPPGWQRDVSLVATRLAVAVAAATRLDVPGRLVDDVRDAFAEQSGDGTATPARSPDDFSPTTADPARMLVAGDSLVGSFGPAMAAAGVTSGVMEGRYEVRYSSGLAQQGLFDWDGFLAAETTERPVEILVFLVGANDGRPIEVGSSWVEFGSDDWVEEYRRRVDGLMRVMGTVPTVYWVGLPVARDQRFSERAALMNDVYRSEASAHPNVHYVDSWAVFVDDRGAYSAYLPDASGTPVLVREPDGVHLTAAGADRLAGRVFAEISADWAIEAP